VSRGVPRCLPVSILVASYLLRISPIGYLVLTAGLVAVDLDIDHAPPPRALWIDQHEPTPGFAFRAAARIWLRQGLNALQKEIDRPASTSRDGLRRHVDMPTPIRERQQCEPHRQNRPFPAQGAVENGIKNRRVPGHQRGHPHPSIGVASRTKGSQLLDALKSVFIRPRQAPARGAKIILTVACALVSARFYAGGSPSSSRAFLQ
jgi:hypothetical protein